MNRTQAICAETSQYYHRQAVCGAPRGPACAVTRRPPSRIDPLRLTRPCAASRIWFSRPQGVACAHSVDPDNRCHSSNSK